MNKINFIAISALLMIFSTSAQASGLDSSIINRLADILNEFRPVIIDISIFLGTYLIIKSLYDAATYDMSPGGQKTGKGMIFLTFLIGVAFVNVTQFYSVSSQSLFGSDYTVISMQEGASGTDEQMRLASYFVMTVVQITGMIGLIKAFTTALKPAEQGGGFSSAIKIAVGASLALNIDKFICAIQTTFSDNAIGDFIQQLSIC